MPPRGAVPALMSGQGFRRSEPYAVDMAARQLHRDMPPEQIDRIWRHPLQIRTLNAVAELLADLRTCDDHADYNDFQRELGRQIYEHELEQAAIARAVKRLRKGDKVQADAQTFRTVAIRRTLSRGWTSRQPTKGSFASFARSAMPWPGERPTTTAATSWPCRAMLRPARWH
jgi:hypothetical protein